MSSLTEQVDLKAISTRARAYSDIFTLPLKDRNWRGNPGDYAGSGSGSSLDFQDHRQYLAGDDPRHINWQAYARTGDYTLKLYREEVRPVVEIIFDISGSMLAEPEKATRALELFYFALNATERAAASASVYIVKGDRWKKLANEAVFSHRWEEEGAKLPETLSSSAPNLVSIPFRPRSLRVLISDALFPAAPESTIQALQHNNGRAIVLCPFSLSESNPSWNGNYEFVDTESSARHDRRIDTSLLKRYLETYQNHFERWKAAAIRAQAPLARIPASGSFEDAIKIEAVPARALHLV